MSPEVAAIVARISMWLAGPGSAHAKIDDLARGYNACASAVAAALAARERLKNVNARRETEGSEEIRVGLALHFGDVMYGNIGAPPRLDFTVIGPAVNRAARLEALCKPLGRDIVTSAEFADLCGRPLEALGSHALKGVAEPQPVFGV